MTPEEVVRAFYDAFNRRDFAGSADLFADPCTYESIASGHVSYTPAEIADGHRAWAAAFPDGHVEMTNVFTAGRYVVVEWSAQGTQTGPLRDEPPSGKKFARRGCAVAEVEDGKIVAYRDYFDRLTLNEQLHLGAAAEAPRS